MKSVEISRRGYGRHRRAPVPPSLEVLENRLLLADGISASPGPQINGSPGVAITSAVVATFKITDSTGSPGSKWNAKVNWGDNTPLEKRLTPTALPDGSFEFLDSHTYAASGNYTVTVMIAVPGSHKPNDNTVMTSAVIASQTVLRSIAVTPANPSVAKGFTEQFTATGTFSDNSTQNLTSQVTWTSGTTSVASINFAGVATALGTGTSTITASLAGISGATVLTVNPAALSSLTVTPANPSVAKGLTEQFAATGTYSDNSTQNLTSQVTWAAGTPSVASVSAAGVATARAVGSTTISAALGGITGATVLTVTPAVLLSIAVTPANPGVPKGESKQLAAVGTYSDNSNQDLTSQVTWASDTTAVATITAGGLAHALATGTSTISAKLGAITGATVLTVTPAALISIAVTPSNSTIVKQTTEQFAATGTFSDDSTQDLTDRVTWASDTTAVATITAAGLATALSAGSSNISATLGGIEGSTVLSVIPAPLSSITVAPEDPSVPKGKTEPFTATGHFDDGSSQDITSQVLWTSTNSAVASVSNAAGSRGQAKALNTGTSTITATLDGKIGSTVLTVTAAVLESIALTPVSPAVPKGETKQFTARGTFSDNSSQDLTAQVTWASTSTSVASITAAGLATAATVGTTEITASSGAITGSTVLTVSPAALLSIAVSPANPAITQGLSEAFTATGTYSDNSTQDVTGQVTWATATATVATITSGGLATGLAPGTSTIRASLAGVTGSAQLVVNAPPLPPLVTVTSVSVVRNKKHLVTEIRVVFSGAVNPTGADNVATYRLAMPGKKGSFTAKNAKVIKLKSAVFNSSLATVTLTPKKPFALTKPVQLVVNGLPPTGLEDSVGRLIDGNHDGQAGGSAVAVLRGKGVTLSAIALSPSSGNPALRAVAMIDQEVVVGLADSQGAPRPKRAIHS
jgi:uncharacterized protein YjdB